MAKSKKRIEAEKKMGEELQQQGWHRSPPEREAELVQAAHAWMAENGTKKKHDRQVPIKMNDDLIAMAKHRAALEGIDGYQTLIRSITYRYLTGRLVDPELAETRGKTDRAGQTKE